MTPSMTFKIVVRIVGAFGFLAGAFLIYVGLVFGVIAKAPEYHVPSLISGSILSLLSLYCLFGSSHLFRVLCHNRVKA